MSAAQATLVLVHGAGHTSTVWEHVQARLQHPSVAVDLPGRRDRAADITSVTIDEAAASTAHDVDAAVHGPVVLVGHSAGGVVLPALAARLGDRVDHLVFVAGLSAPEGRMVIESLGAAAVDATMERLVELRRDYAGHMLDPAGSAIGSSAVDGVRLAGNIDSLNYITQVITWSGVAPSIGRTFVRSLRDPIQPRDLQETLARNCGASTVIDVDAGHSAAIDAPAELAAILDGIAERSRGTG